jgi:hypothetical protein
MRKEAAMSAEAAAVLQAALSRARDTLLHGDPVEAERSAKALSALVKAEREVAEFFAAAQPEEDDEATRAELRRRLAAFVEADLAGAPDAVLERIALAGAAE